MRALSNVVLQLECDKICYPLIDSWLLHLLNIHNVWGCVRFTRMAGCDTRHAVIFRWHAPQNKMNTCHYVPRRSGLKQAH